MPSNKNAMTRYKILDELLSSRYHNYSLDDLTDEVCKRLVELYPDTKGIVRRTIEKDIHYLEYEGPFMVEIERYTVPGYDVDKQRTFVKQCLRYANPSFSIFKKELSKDEEYLLSEALSMLGQFDGLPNLDALENLRLSLDKREEKKIISFTKNPLENTTFFGELFTAISQHQVVELRYHKFGEMNEVQSINIHPYLLKEYNRRWFVFGAAEAGGKLMCFGLDRIDKIVPLTSHKYISYDGDINEVFEDIIGVTIYDNAPLLRIYIWVSNYSKDYVCTKPIHESQVELKGIKAQSFREKYPNLEGGKFFKLECKYNYELERELTSFGKELLVLEPNDLQNTIWRRIEDMHESYRKLRT
jgi:predicted DNA-binding transcriptional regulator YafY